MKPVGNLKVAKIFTSGSNPNLSPTLSPGGVTLIHAELEHSNRWIKIRYHSLFMMRGAGGGRGVGLVRSIRKHNKMF